MTSPSKFYHVIQIVLKMCSCDQSLETVAFVGQNLSQPQFYKDLTRKIDFFEGSVVKVLKIKARMFWGLTPTFAEVTEKDWYEGSFCPTLSPPS